MTREIIDAEDLFDGVETFASMWEWGECYTRNGFQLAIQDPDVLRRVWKIEKKSNEGAAPGIRTLKRCATASSPSRMFAGVERAGGLGEAVLVLLCHKFRCLLWVGSTACRRIGCCVGFLTRAGIKAVRPAWFQPAGRTHFL